MKISASLLALVTAPFGHQVLALPQPQNNMEDVWCSPGDEKLRNLKAEVKTVAPVAVTGASCTSSRSEACRLAKSYEWSSSETLSIGLMAGPKLNTGKLWEASGQASIGYGWTTSQGESTSTTISCPSLENVDGELSCGLMARAYVVEIKGEVRKQEGGTCKWKDWEKFTYRYPHTKKTRNSQANNKDGKDDLRVDFEACINNCSDYETCEAAKHEKLGLCPGSPRPDDLEPDD